MDEEKREKPKDYEYYPPAFKVLLEFTEERGILERKEAEKPRKESEIGEWFHEDNIKQKIANYLVELEGFDPNPTITYGQEQGPDILARKGKIQRRVEVKGWPTKTYVRGPKKGRFKPTNPSTQARHWFAEALRDVLLAKGEDEKLEIALGFPMMKTYVDLLNRIEWARRRLEIFCYLVGQDNKVRPFTPKEPISGI